MTAISTFFTWMGSFFVNTLAWWQWTILAVGAAGHHRAVFLEAQTPAAGSAQHVSVAQARSRTCTSTRSGSGCGGICCCSCNSFACGVDAGPAAAELAGAEAHRQPLHLPGRQFGQHAGDRRRAVAAGRGQTPGRRLDRRDELRRRGHGRQLCRLRPGRADVHRRPPAVAPQPRSDPAHAAAHVAVGGVEGRLGAGQPGPQRSRTSATCKWPRPCRRSCISSATGSSLP